MTTASADPGAFVDPALKKIVILFRLLSLVWMAVLVVIGLTAEEGSPARIGRPEVAVGALALAVVWTGLFLFLARDDRVKSPIFVGADIVVAALVGAASLLADTGELFHGGFPMSSVLVAAYAGGIRLALPGSLLLFVEQLAVRLSLGRSVSSAAFAVVFPFLGFVAGWGFDLVRTEAGRRARAEARLAESEAQQAMLTERAEMADHLHDSVLQTLYAIQARPGDPEEVFYLARRQERELRRTIASFRSPYSDGFRVALMAAADDIADLHRVEVETTVAGDTGMRDELRTFVGVAREVINNAAKHGGVTHVDVFAETGAGVTTVIVRDRGSGLDQSTGDRLSARLEERLERVGGSCRIDSRPGQGTEVTLTLGGTAEAR